MSKLPFNSGLQAGIHEIMVKHWQIPLTSRRAARVDFHPPFNKPPLARLIDQLEKNYSRGRGVHHSKENWRFTENLHLDTANKSSEKILEKEIARHMRDTEIWANQVPTCSGYSKGRDGKRALDLVKDLGSRCFKFIELKTISNTPVFAAAEVVLYGLTYLLARSHGASWEGDRSKILQAKEVHLVVLAPEAFYAHYTISSLQQFERMLDAALADFAKTKILGLRMSFGFEILGQGFDRNASNYSPDAIMTMVAGIRRLFP